MQLNEKLLNKYGYEVALYPMPQMGIIQVSGPGAFTHCCGNAIDINGSSNITPLYAPYTCRLMSNFDPDTNGQIFTNVKHVYCADGKLYAPGTLNFQCGHADTIIAQFGTVYPQGAKIYQSGLKNANGVYHVHFEMGNSSTYGVVGTGIFCTGSTFQCYELAGSKKAESLLFKGNTQILYTSGLNFKDYTGEIWTEYRYDDYPVIMDGFGTDIGIIKIKKKNVLPE